MISRVPARIALRPNPQAAGTCSNIKAHILTLDGRDELLATLSPGDIPLHGNSRLWLGLTQVDGGFGAVNNEPGWAGAGACPGCYVPGVSNSAASLPIFDAGADAGSPSCVTLLDDVPTAQATGCNAAAKVVCEREPVGSRERPCQARSDATVLEGYCFDLVATMNIKKHYFFYTPTTAAKDESAAASYCESLGGHGTPSGTLITFDSPDEREQLLWELNQSGHLRDLQDFWIGLVSVSADGGGVDWAWDDGAQHPISWAADSPSPWRDPARPASVHSALERLRHGARAR